MTQDKTLKVEGPLHVVCQCDKCKAQAQEYVALWYFNQGFGNCMINKLNEAAKNGPTPIYLAPPQRKPLTDEQFRAVLRSLSRQQGWDGDGWDLALKEAIEAAHGIKGEA